MIDVIADIHRSHVPQNLNGSGHQIYFNNSDAGTPWVGDGGGGVG